MNYFGSVLSSLLTTLFFTFAIIAAGYLLGSVKLGKLSLGSSGVLLAALAVGILFSQIDSFTIGSRCIVLFDPAVSKPLYSLISNMGTALFVSAVGLIAGPSFLQSFRKSSSGYAILSVCVIGSGIASAQIIQRLIGMSSSLSTGLLTGALTSTPGLSAAKESAPDPEAVTAGYGIAYLFGVLGVVLFVQLIPILFHADMQKAREELLTNSGDPAPKEGTFNRCEVGPYGIFPVIAAIVLGVAIGSVKIPGIDFSLGTSGGILLAGLLIGHCGHFGPLHMRTDSHMLNIFREFGLALFLVGAGVPAGINFIRYVRPIYFLCGIVITTIPMLVGFVVARRCLKFGLLESLGAITGGMTSTPALGTLITSSGTDQVTASYAATYPAALVILVIAAKISAAL